MNSCALLIQEMEFEISVTYIFLLPGKEKKFTSEAQRKKEIRENEQAGNGVAMGVNISSRFFSFPHPHPAFLDDTNFLLCLLCVCVSVVNPF